MADVWRLVVGGTWLSTETLTLTVNGRDIVVTLGATVTTASIAAAVVAAWNGDAVNSDETRSETGDNIPEFAEATAAIGATTSTVLFTATAKGVPVTISVATTSASGTLTLTNPTPATGANFWSNTDNWSTGAVPANGDTVYVDNSSVDVLYGLAQSGVTLAALYIGQSFTGTIGLPEVNAAGDYHEYRAQYLAIGATVLQIGAGPGNGSGRVKINTGTVQTALSVFNSGTGLDDVPAVVWKGTHASNALVQTGGSLGVGVFGGETATLATVAKSAGDLITGAGVTLSGALTQNGGTWQINSAIATSLKQSGGQTTIAGSGAVALLELRGGTVVYNTTGALGGASLVSGTGALDFTQHPAAKTISNPLDLYGTQCSVDDTNKVTGAVVVDFNEGADPSQFKFGANVRLTRGTPA